MGAAIQTKAFAFTAPKAGRTADENEDAFHAPPDGGTRFAIADGATESSYSKRWAQLLVKATDYAFRPDRGWLWLKLAQWAWKREVPKDLPWYAVENSQRGAFAAFLVLEIEPTHKWTSWSIGDCCLFQVRAGRLVTRWPFSDPSEFNNLPFLVGSRSTTESLMEKARGIFGWWRPGDEFWLATDALAHWLLTQHVADEWPPVGLADVGDDDGFRAWVEARRGEGLRNDDTTLVRVTLS